MNKNHLVKNLLKVVQSKGNKLEWNEFPGMSVNKPVQFQP